jgi:hypothetical protein
MNLHQLYLQRCTHSTFALKLCCNQGMFTLCVQVKLPKHHVHFSPVTPGQRRHTAVDPLHTQLPMQNHSQLQPFTKVATWCYCCLCASSAACELDGAAGILLPDLLLLRPLASCCCCCMPAAPLPAASVSVAVCSFCIRSRVSLSMSARPAALAAATCITAAAAKVGEACLQSTTSKRTSYRLHSKEKHNSIAKAVTTDSSSAD